MRTFYWSLLGTCALISGCIVDSRQTGMDAGGCTSGGSTSTALYCSIDADCTAGLVCGSSYTCVTSSEPSCATHADCAQGSYCDASNGRCTSGTTCVSEPDCAPGFNCNLTRGTCEPASLPTCGELTGATECGERADCRAVYAGVDCSCGAGCQCQGGEPGCVCQSFQFFACAASP